MTRSILSNKTETVCCLCSQCRLFIGFVDDDSALAETRRLKEALDESNELNRTMKLELRLQEMMTKADNKENERGR